MGGRVRTGRYTLEGGVANPISIKPQDMKS